MSYAGCVAQEDKTQQMIRSCTEMFLRCLQTHFHLLQRDALFLSTLIIIFISNLKVIHGFLLHQRLEINLMTICKS